MRIGRLVGMYVVGVALSACGGGDDATARLAFEATDANALSVYAPDTFKMKLIAAYLAEDMDGSTGANVGATSMFFLNDDCNDDIMHCDISGGAAEDGGSIDNVVTSYFDFSPSVDVNLALNAQARGITAATYRYVRLEFCKYNHEGADNILWGGSFDGNEISGATFSQNSCTVNSAVMDPPLVIAEGDVATVTLSYSLAGSVSESMGGGEGSSCAEVDGHTYCFQLPAFSPSASLAP